MHTIQNTLYVITPQAYVHLENATVRIDVEREKKLQVPLHHIGGLVCFGNVMVSPALMHRLADEGKSLVLLDDHGRFKARLEGPVSGNILLRQAQHRQAGDAGFSLELARAVVAGKLKNSRSVLQRGAREAADETEAQKLTRTADNLAASLRAAAVAATLDERIARPHGRARIETTSAAAASPSGAFASPGLTAGRGLKRIQPGKRNLRLARIARPHGRARIETFCSAAEAFHCFCIARPHGRARIETFQPRPLSGVGLASPDLTAGRGLKQLVEVTARVTLGHRPTSRPGAD